MKNRMIFKNASGEEITLAKKPYILMSTDGTGGVQTDVQMQKAPFQDGETYIDSLLEPRRMSLLIAVVDKAENMFTHRAHLSRVFNSKLGPGLLTYEYGYGNDKKEIKAAVEHGPIFPGGMRNSAPGFQRVVIELICPNSYWQDTKDSKIEMIMLEDGFSLPTAFPFSLAAVSGLSEQTIFIYSEVPTPLKIEFEGEAENPKVENKTTGEFIKIAQTIQGGEVLEISTEFGNKYARIGDDNVLHYIDLDSVFWQLQPGWNTIEYTMDSGDGRVRLYYRNRYTGV